MTTEKVAPQPRYSEEPEPWADAVQLDVVLDEIVEVILRYVIVDKPQADAAALWVAHTYLIDCSNVSPIAIINAPERACAKTLFQTVLGEMVLRPMAASNATVPVLFRAVSSFRPTILLDEGDTFFKDKPELHGLMNAGYGRTGCVLRTETNGDKYEVRSYPVYSAKSIAGIALERHLPDATMSRGIVFNMRRKLAHESVLRFRNVDQASIAAIRSKLARVAVDEGANVATARPPLPDELGDRAQDNWEPLLAIASCAGPDWLARATQAAIAMTSRKEVQGGASNELLGDIREVVGDQDRITSIDLIALLMEDPEMAWATYNRGKAITPRQLANFLGLYGIAPRTVRMGSKTPKGYYLTDFTEAFERYLDERDVPPPAIDRDADDGVY